jgi:arabinan endo-1,5-alpha-L-arabinosidase
MHEGTHVVQANKDWPGVGPNSVWPFDGDDLMLFHACDVKANGKPKLMVITIRVR